MADIKLEDVYYVCFFSCHRDDYDNYDYEEIYYGLDNAIKAVEDKLDWAEFTMVIRHAEICSDGSFGYDGIFAEPPFVLKYQTLDVTGDIANRTYTVTYYVIDSDGNTEQRSKTIYY